MSEFFRSAVDPSAESPWQVLASGSQTGGLLTFGVAELPPRTPGPSFHVHTREDEAVFVIEGMFTVKVGDDVMEVGSGELVWLPRGIPHTFGNLSAEPVRTVGAIVPGGLEGMFEDQAVYFASLTGPPDEGAVAEIGAKYGVSVVGPPLEVTHG